MCCSSCSDFLPSPLAWPVPTLVPGSLSVGKSAWFSPAQSSFLSPCSSPLWATPSLFSGLFMLLPRPVPQILPVSEFQSSRPHDRFNKEQFWVRLADKEKLCSLKMERWCRNILELLSSPHHSPLRAENTLRVRPTEWKAQKHKEPLDPAIPAGASLDFIITIPLSAVG